MALQTPIRRHHDLDPTRTPAATTGRDPFLALHDGVNRLFDEALRSFGTPALGDDGFMPAWPSIEVTDDGDALRVDAELPGMTDRDVEILLEDGALILRGERQDTREDSARRFSERRYGRFERRIPLESAIDEERVAASFREGVLTVTLPKAGESRGGPRRIEIGTA